MDVRHNNNALKELNDCIRGLLHLGLNVITFRTLLHLGQLLHLGLQQLLHEGWPQLQFCLSGYRRKLPGCGSRKQFSRGK